MSSILRTALEKVRGAQQDRRRTVEKGNAHKVTTEGTVVERRPVRETTWSRLLDSIDFPSFSFHQGAIRLLYPGSSSLGQEKRTGGIASSLQTMSIRFWGGDPHFTVCIRLELKKDVCNMEGSGQQLYFLEGPKLPTQRWWPLVPLYFLDYFRLLGHLHSQLVSCIKRVIG
jgi:hypothetical protein